MNRDDARIRTTHNSDWIIIHNGNTTIHTRRNCDFCLSDNYSALQLQVAATRHLQRQRARKQHDERKAAVTLLRFMTRHPDITYREYCTLNEETILNCNEQLIERQPMPHQLHTPPQQQQQHEEEHKQGEEEQQQQASPNQQQQPRLNPPKQYYLLRSRSRLD